jgi:dTDP-4-amino-4,6-dideoxygalactose transaminase
MNVPMVDLRAQYRRIQSDVDAAMRRVVEATAFVNGEECGLFEREFASWCGATHAIGVANGTDALTLTLRAYGVGPGDEVVTVANTFIATGEAILLNGATPVFVDVDEASFTMDPAALERAITPRTKVVIPVHLYGHPCDMVRISAVAARHGVPVLEDAAQAHGAAIGGRRAGSLGHAACFSFYPGKNLGAYGDAGAVVTSDAEFAAKVRRIANHGAGAERYLHAVPGTNSRLDNLQAAILRVKLPHMERWNHERRERAEAYTSALERVPAVTVPREQPWGTTAWHLYTIRTKDRDALQAHLASRGIASAVHYPRPIHLQPALAVAGGKPGDLPVSERLSNEVLSVPLYPELPLEEVARVADEVAAFSSTAVVGS